MSDIIIKTSIEWFFKFIYKDFEGLNKRKIKITSYEKDEYIFLPSKKETYTKRLLDYYLDNIINEDDFYDLTFVKILFYFDESLLGHCVRITPIDIFEKAIDTSKMTTGHACTIINICLQQDINDKAILMLKYITNFKTALILCAAGENVEMIRFFHENNFDVAVSYGSFNILDVMEKNKNAYYDIFTGELKNCKTQTCCWCDFVVRYLRSINMTTTEGDKTDMEKICREYYNMN